MSDAERIKWLESEIDRLTKLVEEQFHPNTVLYDNWTKLNDKVKRLAKWVGANYYYEIEEGKHAGVEWEDLCIRYMSIERDRWRIRLRNIFRRLGR